MPLFDRLRYHVMAAEGLHGDDTTVPVLASGKTDIARAWVDVRDDRPFGGTMPPAALLTIPAIPAARIRKRTSQDMLASSRPTRTVVTASSTNLAEVWV